VRELWSVHAVEDACDIAMRAPGAGRVAADEVVVRGPVADDLRLAIEHVDPQALIRRSDEGWVELVLDGGEARDVVARLSELELPEEGYVQGDVARVGARLFADRHRLVLLVPAPFETHLRRRIEEASRP
jgi:hypothetical protein